MFYTAFRKEIILWNAERSVIRLRCAKYAGTSQTCRMSDRHHEGPAGPMARSCRSETSTPPPLRCALPSATTSPPTTPPASGPIEPRSTWRAPAGSQCPPSTTSCMYECRRYRSAPAEAQGQGRWLDHPPSGYGCRALLGFLLLSCAAFRLPFETVRPSVIQDDLTAAYVLRTVAEGLSFVFPWCVYETLPGWPHFTPRLPGFLWQLLRFWPIWEGPLYLRSQVSSLLYICLADTFSLLQ